MIVEFPVPIYVGSLIVCVSKTPREEIKEAGLKPGLSKNAADRSDAWVHACTDDVRHGSDEIPHWIIALRPSADAETIAHEALHALNYMMDYFGMEMSAGSDEHAAYLLGWIVARAHDVLEDAA